jgi:hypothetical protein
LPIFASHARTSSSTSSSINSPIKRRVVRILLVLFHKLNRTFH